MIKISIKKDLGDLNSWIQAEPERFRTFLDRLREEAGSDAVDILQRNSPVKTGKLRDSFESVPTETGFRIEMEDYGWAVEAHTGFISRSITELTGLLEDLIEEIAEEVWS